MKNLIVLTLISVLYVGQLYAQNANPYVVTESTSAVNPNAPVAKWEKTVFDFGDIEQGTPKEAQFKLTNTGKEPLLIQTARAGCGCTNLKYSQEPILPGKSTIVAATYNAAAMGQFSKSVTVTTNADPNPLMLIIKGNVVVKK